MKCIECGSETFNASEISRSVTIEGRAYQGSVLGLRCASCGWAYVQASDMVPFELGVAEHIARHGPVTAGGLASMREALGLRSKQLAQHLGVTPEHLSRWENDRKPIDHNAWLVVGDLVLDAVSGRSTTLDRLASMRAPCLDEDVSIHSTRRE